VIAQSVGGSRSIDQEKRYYGHGGCPKNGLKGEGVQVFKLHRSASFGTHRLREKGLERGRKTMRRKDGLQAL